MSQETAILEFLKAGNTLTPLEGLQLFSTMRLGARCWNLKKQGYNIQSRIIKGVKGKHYAEYYIPREKQLELGA